LVPDPNTHQLVPVNLNSAVVPYLNLYPLPNGRNFGDGTAQYITDFSQAANEDYSMERMDFRLSDKDNFYWRYVFDSSSSVIPRPLPTFVEAITQGNHFVTLSETHIFSGTSLNEFRFGFNRADPISDAKSLVPIDPSLSFVPGQPFGIIRQGGTGLVGQLVEMGRLFTAQNYAQNLFQETDTFSTVRGAHSLKFGADVERIQLNLNSGSTAGNYLFTGLRSLLAGQPTQFSVTLLGGTSTLVRTWRRNLFAWFVQDDFRLRPNLTLNLGLRHEFFTTPTELHGRSAALLHVTDPEVTPGPPFISSKTNFSPRVGLAWDPTGTGKTSVRLGAGMFYNLTDGRNWYMAAGAGPQFTTSVTVNDPPFPNGLASGFALGRPSVSGLEQHPNEPTVIHYNLEVQRQLARTLSLRVGYVGSDGYHMQRLTYQNIRIPQILGDGSKSFPATGPVVNPNFADITKVLTDAHYNYNALQAVLQKTVSAGLQFQASYTFSKAMSDADEVGNAQTTAASPTTLDLSNLARDYSLSVYDQRQTLVLSGRYAIPWDKRLNGRAAKAALGGWAVNGIYSYGSGLPTNVNTGFNNSRSGDLMVTDRPDLAPGASNNPIQGVTAGCQGIPAGQKLGTPDRWYDPCAFVLQRAGTFGNLGRNTVIGPGLSSVDFTLVKSTSLAEKKQLEFRAEFFNLLNHAKFGLPLRNVFSSSGLRSGNGGVITSTATSNREVQLGLKLIF